MAIGRGEEGRGGSEREGGEGRGERGGGESRGGGRGRRLDVKGWVGRGATEDGKVTSSES